MKKKSRVLPALLAMAMLFSVAFSVTATASELTFSDVPSNAYYYEAVSWAISNEITNGTSSTTFSPDDSCTRAQAVTFIYRYYGAEWGNGSTNFDDVPPSAYYAPAVAWAVNGDITNGTSATKFSPDATCTRAQIVTLLYRCAGEPDVTSSVTFSDVDTSGYYADAVLWAISEGITAGTSTSTFSPDDVCTRAQIVTFLYRYDGHPIAPVTPVEPTPTPTPTPSPVQPTVEQTNALAKAESYLKVSSFSYEKLIDQLEYVGFSHEAAVYAADNCGADWYEQALSKAKSYLNISAFSWQGLIDQLEYVKFTTEQATYAANNCGADWYEQAAKKAASYLEISSFSKTKMISQLEYVGFTHDQAVYGAEANGL